MKRLLVLLFFMSGYSVMAQTFPWDMWHDGKVILDTGDTLRGSIKYSLQDLLEVHHSNRLESFSARKIISFEIFDQYYKRYRQFFSLPYSANGGYKVPTFFELVCEGKITLLCREKTEYRSNGYSPFYPTPMRASGRMVLVNMYFLLRENGNIESTPDRRADWMDLMKQRENDVHDFVKENRLDFTRKYDLKRIIDFYNSFFQH